MRSLCLALVAATSVLLFGPALASSGAVTTAAGTDSRRLTALEVPNRSMLMFFRKGIGAVTTCSGPCTVALKATVSEVTRQRYHLRSRVIASANLKLTRAGTKTVRLRPPLFAARKIRRAPRLGVTVTATQAGRTPPLFRRVTTTLRQEPGRQISRAGAPSAAAAR